MKSFLTIVIMLTSGMIIIGGFSVAATFDMPTSTITDLAAYINASFKGYSLVIVGGICAFMSIIKRASLGLI